MPVQRFLMPALLVVFVGAGVALVVTTVRGGGPPDVFLAFWLAGVCWNVYWWGWRMCTEVSVDAVTLRWRTAFFNRQAPVGNVVRIGPSRMSRQLATIELQGARSLLVPVRYGFGELTQAITAAAPHATVEHA